MEKLMIVLACIYHEDLAKCLEQNRAWMQERVDGGRRLFCGSAPLVVANSASFPLYSLPFRLGEDPQNSISWHPVSSGVVWHILPMITCSADVWKGKRRKEFTCQGAAGLWQKTEEGFSALTSRPSLKQPTLVAAKSWTCQGLKFWFLHLRISLK